MHPPDIMRILYPFQAQTRNIAWNKKLEITE